MRPESAFVQQLLFMPKRNANVATGIAEIS